MTKMLQAKKEKLYVCLASGAIFLASLTQTAVITNELENKTTSGFIMFLIGGIAIAGGGTFEWMIWLANPLFFLSIILFLKNNTWSKFTAILALTIALIFSTWKSILISESGRMGEIRHLGLGYWLWVMSFFILTVGVFYPFLKTDQKRSNN